MIFQHFCTATCGFSAIHFWLTRKPGSLVSSARYVQQRIAVRLPSCGYIMSKLAWPFTSQDLWPTFVQQLEAVATRFLKQWSGSPRPANTAIVHLGSSNRAGLHITQLTTFWKQMQAVWLDIVKNSSDPRCSRLYDRLLANLSQWSRRYPPAVEHACAATVVEANLPGATTQLTSIDSTSGRRKRILNIIAEIDTESQLATLRQSKVCKIQRHLGLPGPPS